jgi:hypothetical protein
MWLNKLIDAVERFIIEAALEQKAAAHPELDWRHSIVDLMKLVGQDSSLQARIRLAKEMGYEGPPLHGEAAMNEYLHRRVLAKLGIAP